MKHQGSALRVVLSLALFGAASAQAQSGPAPIQVTAWGQHLGDKIVYRYEVRNLGHRPIKRFLIGHFPDPHHGRAELTEEPATTGDSFWLSSEAATAPEGWGAKIVYPEESSTFSIEWIEAGYHRTLWPKAPVAGPAAIAQNPGIPPGATWGHYTVTVPALDTAYVKGHVSIDDESHLINIPMTQGDRIAPTVRIEVKPPNPDQGDGTWAALELQVHATDNFDPNPSLVMQPVTSNQAIRKGDVVTSRDGDTWHIRLRKAPGRIYRFRYTAMDACGNAAAKAFEYAVDEGRR